MAQSSRGTPGNTAVSIPYENPLKTARKELNLSLHQLSVKAGVSRSVIIRAEHGMYERIPSGLLKYLKEKSHQDNPLPLLNTAYHHWQTAVRRANRDRLEDFPYHSYRHLLYSSPVGTHPLAYWLNRQHIATTYFGRLFCIPSSVLVRFLNEPNLHNSLPASLENALIDAGFDRVMLTDLKLAFEEYRDYTRTEVLCLSIIVH